MVQTSHAIYTAEPVAIADVWSHDLELGNPAMGEVRVSNEYRTTGVEEGEERSSR